MVGTVFLTTLPRPDSMADVKTISVNGARGRTRKMSDTIPRMCEEERLTDLLTETHL